MENIKKRTRKSVSGKRQYGVTWTEWRSNGGPEFGISREHWFKSAQARNDFVSTLKDGKGASDDNN